MPNATLPLDILIRKRDGQELSFEEIKTFVRAVVRNHDSTQPALDASHPEFLTDPQIASFLMAVFQRGLSPRELADLTQAMRYSGQTLSAPGGRFTVDKHSTGGVGDKTSLLIAPILAAASTVACPIAVPMISGRALGHTGGTLDKLESIPGFNTQLSLERVAILLKEQGAVLVGQTPELVPADRILYALRDHTGTVESPFLITASIMSKKLAEDLRGLVLDVKVGSGAFMPSYEASRHLAELLVSTGEQAGTRTVALLTSMDQPLGRFAGNWLEVQECVELLQGTRHHLSSDLLELSLLLSGYMLHLAEHPEAKTPSKGAAFADHLLRSGAALEAWYSMVTAQGGDTACFQHAAAHHAPKASRTVHAKESGYLAGMDCKQIGWAVQRLGAGRTRPGDPVSAHAGLEVHAKVGTPVSAGQSLFTLYAESPSLLDEPFRMISETLRYSPEPPFVAPLVHEVVSR